MPFLPSVRRDPHLLGGLRAVANGDEFVGAGFRQALAGELKELSELPAVLARCDAALGLYQMQAGRLVVLLGLADVLLRRG